MTDAQQEEPVLLTEEARQAIVAHAQRAYPAECCGILVGKGSHIEHAVPADNIAEAIRRHDRYVVDPLAIARSDRAARKEEKEVIGFYHSHPDHPARASRTDAEHAWEGYLYLIVSVSRGKAEELTAWRKPAGQLRALQQLRLAGRDSPSA